MAVAAVIARLIRGRAIVAGWNDNAPAVRIEQHFGRIESQAVRRIERTIDPIAVKLPLTNIRHKDVPVVVAAVCRRIEPDDAGRRGIVVSIEEQQLDARRMPRKEAEIRAAIN